MTTNRKGGGITIFLKGHKHSSPFERMAEKAAHNREEYEIFLELKKLAKEIDQLTNQFNVISGLENTIMVDRISYRLSAAEQEFYLLFNKLREFNGCTPYSGSRFNENFKYKDLFNFPYISRYQNLKKGRANRSERFDKRFLRSHKK